jgi:hypothetical protein
MKEMALSTVVNPVPPIVSPATVDAATLWKKRINQEHRMWSHC